jgi:hypothetical protein
LEDSWRQAKEHFVEIRKECRGDQITDWNLACCELKLGNRQAALNILRERVDSGAYIDDVLEGAILLALEFGEKRFLSEQLDWLPCEEAILLGYLFAADSQTPREELEKWLSPIEVIASDARGFEPPHPAEEISPRDLDNLCFEFNRRRMRRGGITWFRRRVSFKDHEYIYLNWRLLGDLSLQVGLSDDAVRCYSKSLNCTSKARVNPEIKQQSTNEILDVLCQKNLIEAAGEILAKYSGMLSPVDIRRWQLRTKSVIEPAKEPDRKSPEEHREVERETEPSPPQDPQLRLAQINNQLLKVRRLAALKGDFSLFREGAATLAEISPAYSRRLVEQLHITIQSLQNFDSSSNLKDKERFGQELRDNTAELSTVLQGVTEPQLKVNAEDLLTVLRNLGKEATFQTSVIRDIEIDWRLNGYLPDKTLPPVSPELPKTCLLLQITNRGTEKVTEVNVHLANVSGRVSVTVGIQRLDIPLEPGASAVLRFPLDYDSFVGEEHFSAHVSFSSGGVTGLQTRPIPFSIYAKSFSENLRGQELIRDAFFTGVGIPEDRRDVFHGRDREQKRIANSLSGNVQSEVLFLNGPRRVGKTSILNSLKWALPELGLKELICVDLGEEIPSNTGEYLQAIAAEVVKAVNKHLNVNEYLKPPAPEEFKSEPIAAFKRFCETAQKQLAPRRVLIMVDETQRLAQAVKTGRLDDNVLSLFSTLMSRNTGIMFIFTASVLFRDVKDLSSNPIWGRLVPFAVGFLNADAVSQVLEAGVAPFPVKFTREAINRVWQMTEGHPWIVQAIGKRIVNDVLNPQRRLVVGPADVDQVVEFIEKYENQYCSFWWNERKEEGGFADEADWAIAKVVIEHQERPGMGIPKSLLFRCMTEQAIPINHERINKLVDMQTLVKEARNSEEYVRIKGLFLERWLTDQIGARHVLGTKPNIALFVDHENVSISMQKYIEQLPAPKQSAWAHTRDPIILARKLAQNAERHGAVVSRIAVANWPLFAKDLQPYAQAMFGFDQPLGGKNSSDEKIKQLIRDTLEQKPEVGTYILAAGDQDYRDTIQTLLKRNKRVILWGFRAVGTVRSNMAGIFREMESWQNLTIEYLDDILLREITSKPPSKT